MRESIIEKRKLREERKDERLEGRKKELKGVGKKERVKGWREERKDESMNELIS